MTTVVMPHQMNQAFADAFNSGDLNNLMALYEEDAILRIDADNTFTGKDAIAIELGKLLQIPGRMTSLNNFCIEHGDIALLRADFSLAGPDGATILAGSTAEVVRRQRDGGWLYIIDHAAGSSLPRVDLGTKEQGG